MKTVQATLLKITQASSP